MRGRPLELHDPGLTQRETLLGDVLQHFWFALMVGWSGSLQSPATIQERMREAVELVLEGAGGGGE